MIKPTLWFLFLVLSPMVLAQNVTIALLADGVGAREDIPVEQLKAEIDTLLRPQFAATFVHRDGGWTEEGVNQAIIEALADPNIDIVVTQGLVGTHIAGKIPSLSKPVVGTFVPEPRLQGLPLSSNNTSGKNNYVYMSDLKSFDDSMATVLSILPKKKIAMIADELIINGVPMLANPSFYGDYDIQIVAAGESVDDTLAGIPDDVGSVLIAPLLRFDDQDIQKLSNTLVARGLPSVSFAGDIGVRSGFLISVGAEKSETKKYARRIALNILNIMEGSNASELSVKLQFGESLQYNTDTADLLSFELPWEISLTAQAYSGGKAEAVNQRSGMSLNTAVNLGLDRNLVLAQQRLDLEIAADDLRAARSNWWPQLNLEAQFIQLDEAITSLANPERSTDAVVGVSQLLYSEPAKANLDIAALNQKLSQYQLDTVILDTIQNVSLAYISALRAKALEKVQRSNLSVSVKNLKLAENRFALGAVTESDVLRWESQIATDKQNLLSAQSSTRNAIVNLQNLLHQPVNADIYFNESDTQRLISLSLSKQVREVFNDPVERKLLRKFILFGAVNNSPEIKQVNIANLISARSTKAAKRAFYVPDVSLFGQHNYNLERSGAFSSQADAALIDNSWSVGVAASYPIFQGRKRQADLAKAQRQERQAVLNSYAVEDAIRANALSQWNLLTASYPAIFLSQTAANAAQRTLEMISEQYSSGAINITTLIDAQNAAFAADIAATEAQYSYLIDYVNLGRSLSDFSSIVDEQIGNQWLEDFAKFKLRGGPSP